MKHQLVTAGFLASFAASVHAAPLWQNTESGMSVADVRRAQPLVQIPNKVDTLHGGARCELVIEGYEVSSTRFKVCFFFRNEKLIQVMLNADKGSKAQFETLLDLLRARYGPEIGSSTHRCKSTGIMTTCDADWLLKSGANVGLLYLAVGSSDPDPVLNINYQTRMAAEVTKL